MISNGFVIWLHSERDLVDYKFYCFNGNPKYCQVIKDRFSEETIDFFDMEWNHEEFTGLFVPPPPPPPHSSSTIPKPIAFEIMKQCAASLSADIPFLRVDFYEVNRRMYFGELTFYPLSGFGQFDPDCWNIRIGEELILQ